MALLCCGGYLLSICTSLPTLLAILFITVAIFRVKKVERKVCIVVLGDIGRSPRMQYHANSFAEEKFRVNIVGFRGATPIKSLQNNTNIDFTYLAHPPNKPPMLPGSLYYVFKAIYQWIQLFITLFLAEKPAHFLVQNPPAIPTLSVVLLISWIKGSRFIIDWHNYAYTIMAMNLKTKDHILVKFSKWYEGLFGYLSHTNLCVTEAMKNDLFTKWNVKAFVLYDRPPGQFKETSLEEKHDLFLRLSEEYTSFSSNSENSTVFTRLANGKVVYQENCPALIVSSTSWTEDEDFSILLKALQRYDEQKNKDSSLPNLVCVITGKGPQKSFYQDILNKNKFSHVDVITPWLSSDDYPKVIGSATLGICLHTSSSGLDLPMKVVDMFGCTLPVCAVNFSCLDELVKHDVNGLVFETPEELFNQMVDLLKGFPSNCEKLKTFKDNLSVFQKERWHGNWTKVVLPLVS